MGRVSASAPLNMSPGPVAPMGPAADALRALFRAHYQKLVNDYPYPEYKDKDNSPRFVAPASPASARATPRAAPRTTPPAATAPRSTPATPGTPGGTGSTGLSEALTFCCKQCGHSDKLQAEELNSIVGNAFRMAYAAQLQRQDATLSKPANINNNNIFVHNNNNTNNNNELRHTWAQQLITSGPTPPPAPPLPPAAPTAMSRVSRGLPLRSTATPGTIANPCSPESDDSNSPTELNSYRRLGDKPPLIKRLALGLTGRESVEEDADVAPLVSGVVESPTNNNLVEDSPVSAPLGGALAGLTALQGRATLPDNVSKHADVNSRLSQCAHTGSMDLSELKGKRISQISSCSSGVSSAPGTTPAATASNANGTVTNANSSAPTPPPLPERTDSLTGRPEDGDLRAAPWFQAGIPREIALEVLGREPVGAFMVRESTTKLGCFALSLRVPRDFQPSGIAHYLILRTIKGYKIKGFTKEFSTLLALITHHSVMPELLPVPLALSRKHVNSSRGDTSRDFADVDTDPDYNTLADFRKIMADLNV